MEINVKLGICENCRKQEMVQRIRYYAAWHWLCLKCWRAVT